MTYRKKIEQRKQMLVLAKAEKKEKRPITPIKCDDDNLDKLMAQIVRSALYDYCEKVPKIKKNATQWERTTANKIRHDKATATTFFNKSKLFELTGLSFEYLLRTYKKEQRYGK